MGSDEVTGDDVLEAIHDHPDPVVTAPELADRLPCVARTVNNRLGELVAAGDVERKEVGGRSVVYWLPGTRKPRPDAAPRERSLAPDQADLQAVGGAESGGGAESAPVGREGVRELVDELDIPGNAETLDARREAMVDLYEHLRMNGAAEKSEFLKVLEAHEHGFASGESFWKNVVSGEGTLSTLPGVESPTEGRAVWRFDG